MVVGFFCFPRVFFRPLTVEVAVEIAVEVETVVVAVAAVVPVAVLFIMVFVVVVVVVSPNDSLGKASNSDHPGPNKDCKIP